MNCIVLFSVFGLLLRSGWSLGCSPDCTLFLYYASHLQGGIETFNREGIEKTDKDREGRRGGQFLAIREVRKRLTPTKRMRPFYFLYKYASGRLRRRWGEQLGRKTVDSAGSPSPSAVLVIFLSKKIWQSDNNLTVKTFCFSLI